MRHPKGRVTEKIAGKERTMDEDLVTFYQMPPLHAPILIMGFGGWSNAGNISVKTVEYIIREKKATLLADIDPDSFYQFTQNRPVINVKEGKVQSLSLQKLSFYVWPHKGGKHDIILFKGKEPDFRWTTFVRTVNYLCKRWGVSHIICIGGLYDEVLHTDAVVSGVYSVDEWREVFIKEDINLIEYEGPSGIHSLIMQRADKEGRSMIGFWGHSPLYLRGTNFGVVIRVIDLISAVFGFSVDTRELVRALKEFEQQMGEIIKSNAELTEHIEKIKKLRSAEPQTKDTPKVINIKDFIRPKDS